MHNISVSICYRNFTKHKQYEKCNVVTCGHVQLYASLQQTENYIQVAPCNLFNSIG